MKDQLRDRQYTAAASVAGVVQLQLNEAHCTVQSPGPAGGRKLTVYNKNLIFSRKIYFISSQYAHTVAIYQSSVLLQ